jgi:hypothetical protein
LERASRLSLRRHDPDVTPEHLLVSVLDVEGRAGQVLRGLGVDLVTLRAALEPPQAEVGAAAAVGPPAGAVASPSCATCGSPLETTLAHRVIDSSGPAAEAHRFVIAFCSACGSAVGASPSGIGTGAFDAQRAKHPGDQGAPT